MSTLIVPVHTLCSIKLTQPTDLF